MRNGKTFWTICLLLLVNSGLFAQRIRLLNTSGGVDCPGTLCTSNNPVRFTVVTSLPGDSLNLPLNPSTAHNPPRRFKGFWIMGDGNFLQFSDTNDDAISRTPTPYNYAAPGDYKVSAYLTGKYTNTNWPRQAVMKVKSMASPGSTPTKFTSLLKGSSDVIKLSSNHGIRRENLTAFVISYARAKRASGIYFFYNGVIDVHTPKRDMHKTNTPILQHYDTEIPLYFNGKMDTTRIKSYETVALQTAGRVDGLSFTNAFKGLATKFRDFIYFPAETAIERDMPAGFLEKRLFPILQAHPDFMPEDTLMNFLVVLTGPEPLKNAALDSLLAGLSPGLALGNPINTSGNERKINDKNYTPDRVLQVPTAGPQYIQAIDQYPLAYQVTFDPNQLTVEDIKPSSVTGEYDVRFRLEMCNKGQAIVPYELVSVNYSANFHDFKPLSPVIINEVHNGQTWSFKADTFITGAQPQDHVSQCIYIEFTAKTNCDGVRSLWKNNPVQPVEACVVFAGAIDTRPECNTNFSIDSTQFQIGGKGICCQDSNPHPTCPFNWLLWLIIFLILIILFLLRKFFRRSQP